MFDPAALSKLFPFYLAINHNLLVEGIGPSLQKMLPNTELGDCALEYLEFRSPQVLNTFDEMINAQQCQVQMCFSDLRGYLAGEFWLCQETGFIYYFGSPVLQSPEMLSSYNLKVSDFAHHDVNVSHMVLQQMHAIQLNEINTTAASLRQTIDEVERVKKTEQTLRADLDAACDVYMRVSSDGVVSACKCTESTPMPGGQRVNIGDNVFESDENLKNAVINYSELSGMANMVRYEFTLPSKDKEVHYSARVALCDDGQFLYVARDTSDFVNAQKELEYLSKHDELTGLGNRRLFIQELNRTLSQSRETDKNFALLLLDLDDFKRINDTYGHSAGDLVLKTISARLSDAIRSDDISTRLGGDEFGLLLSNVTARSDIDALVDRMLSSIAEPIETNIGVLTISATAGLVVPRRDDDADLILRAADLALYDAKAGGKKRFSWYTDSMHENYVQRHELLNDLREAIENRELTLNYQPIISLSEKRICSFEALARWCHPQKGWIRPDIFIGLAEEFNCIGELSAVLFERLCCDIATFHHAGLASSDVRFNFNISAKELKYRGLAGKMIKTIERHKLDPQTITLELTETALIDEFDFAKKELEELQAHGMSIALDDFGKGYSSLSYLAKLPVDLVKIDKSFVQMLSNDGNRINTELVSAVVGLQDSLGIKVVAEGIETIQQFGILSRMGCLMGQGFYLAKPAPIDQAIDHMRYGIETLRSA